MLAVIERAGRQTTPAQRGEKMSKKDTNNNNHINSIDYEEILRMTHNLWEKARQFSKIAKLQVGKTLRKKMYQQKHNLISLAIEKNPHIIHLLNNKETYWAVYCEGMGILHLDPYDLSPLAYENLTVNQAG